MHKKTGYEAKIKILIYLLYSDGNIIVIKNKNFNIYIAQNVLSFETLRSDTNMSTTGTFSTLPNNDNKFGMPFDNHIEISFK